MKIIFLDVDGVLNTRLGSLDADKLDILQSVVQATGAAVVISSTWRHHEHQMVRLRPELERRGIRIAGQTPISASRDPSERFWVASTRGAEIESWLTDHPGVSRFVILDDSDFTALKGWLVQTNASVGLTDIQAHEMIRRLV
jgi:hypothetical protein